jgi:hypothetical protein
MKKPIQKLAVRRETIRALATLELAHAVGGNTALVPETETCRVFCTFPVAIEPLVGG